MAATNYNEVSFYFIISLQLMTQSVHVGSQSLNKSTSSIHDLRVETLFATLLTFSNTLQNRRISCMHSSGMSSNKHSGVELQQPR